MIIRATSNTIRNIWLSFMFIFFILITVLGTLIYGVTIEVITLPKLKIEQLYIKLDKKLIVSIDYLYIDTPTKNDTSLEESAFVIEHFYLMNQLFKSIHIKKLAYQNETFSLHFEDDIFELQSSQLNTKLNFIRTGKQQFDITLKEATLKDFNLSLMGKLSVDLANKHYTFDGNYTFFEIEGMTALELKNSLLSYHIQSKPFHLEHLDNFMNFVSPKAELDPLIKEWIHQNIVAEQYELHFLEGRINIDTGEYFPLEMRAHAIVKDANVSFAPAVAPAQIREIGISLENDQLSFDVQEALYENHPIQKAEVYLYNLVAKGTGIVVNLFANAPLDDKIHRILHAFHIDVPLTQTSGSIDANVRLDIKFLPFDINATGSFSILPSDFTLNNLEMHTNYGKILLDNKHILFEKANMRYKNLFDINVTGNFNTSHERFDGLIDINTLNLNFGEATLLSIHQLKEQEAFLSIDKNGTHMALPSLETKLFFGKDANTFSLNNLTKITPYTPLIKSFGNVEGKALLSTKDFGYYEANVSLTNLTTPLLENREMIKVLDISLTSNTKTLNAHTLDNKLRLHYDANLSLHVKDLNISLPKESDETSLPIAITITGENVSFEMEESNKSILSEHFTLYAYKDDFTLHSKHYQSDFNVEKKKNTFMLSANTMSEAFTNALLGNYYFHKGNFSLQMEGENSKKNTATFIMQETYIKDLKFFNNLMATINTIPSLLIFSDPNFNQEGYFVKNGYIEFEQKGEEILIHELNLKGSSADIFGSGSINLTNDTLQLKLQIRTLQTFSSIIDLIPIVGGVILGEDKKISTNISVTGSLKDPKIETHLVTDTLMGPVNIIKRTLELPLNLFK